LIYDLQIRDYLEHIESYLDKQCFQYKNEPQQDLFSAMRYSLLAGGKRIRPIMAFAFCDMCGNAWQKAAPFAAAVEMIHTYSLIHDDLPCMDNDDFRRGRPTNHKVYGEAVAVLAGDALLTAAFERIADADLTAQARIDAIKILSSCAGEKGMVGGQILDMESECRECTQQDVIDIQSRKTGALIRAACQLGVLAGAGSNAQLEAAGQFADHLGLAFQIRDDMLDVIGDPSLLGKATGTDENKNTFVQLYGLNKCDDMVKLHTNEAIKALNAFNNSDFMEKLAIELVSRTK
jgi:geranylgeranyl diphosphate synthase type II